MDCIAALLTFILLKTIEFYMQSDLNKTIKQRTNKKQSNKQ